MKKISIVLIFICGALNGAAEDWKLSFLSPEQYTATFGDFDQRSVEEHVSDLKKNPKDGAAYVSQVAHSLYKGKGRVWNQYCYRFDAGCDRKYSFSLFENDRKKVNQMSSKLLDIFRLAGFNDWDALPLNVYSEHPLLGLFAVNYWAEAGAYEKIMKTAQGLLAIIRNTTTIISDDNDAELRLIARCICVCPSKDTYFTQDKVDGSIFFAKYCECEMICSHDEAYKERIAAVLACLNDEEYAELFALLMKSYEFKGVILQSPKGSKLVLSTGSQERQDEAPSVDLARLYAITDAIKNIEHYLAETWREVDCPIPIFGATQIRSLSEIYDNIHSAIIGAANKSKAEKRELLLRLFRDGILREEIVPNDYRAFERLQGLSFLGAKLSVEKLNPGDTEDTTNLFKAGLLRWAPVEHYFQQFSFLCKEQFPDISEFDRELEQLHALPAFEAWFKKHQATLAKHNNACIYTQRLRHAGESAILRQVSLLSMMQSFL